MKICFYYVKEEYINYLKQEELKNRGFTCVPNVTYANRNKFLYGSVLTINEMNYFVPISSKVKKNQEYNLNIKIDDKRKSVVGSLRFQYMIPVPAECLQMLVIDNFTAQSDRIKISKELKFCRKNKDKIHNYALKAYSNVTNKNNPRLVKNSCDFKLLEEACEKYGSQVTV
ncbi:MAG: type III toxin-antitoxin system ToxN/AbiQ family toxin [Oscillospiraceae bacterium]|nr:type III toxin-antitoxin system ToxN/AbiQ family toxin [Oscillospiraceae bacterium]